MDCLNELERSLTRRHLFGRSATGIGAAALASRLNPQPFSADATKPVRVPGVMPMTHLRPKVKRIIYLFMSGGPSQIDLLDYRPKLKEFHGQERGQGIACLGIVSSWWSLRDANRSSS